MKQHDIVDDSICSFSYEKPNPNRPKTIMIIHQDCPKKTWMEYYFDVDSSVWKANSWGKRRKYEYRLVYDSTFQLKITDVERSMFEDVMKHADSMNISIFKNLRKATGFIKTAPPREY